MANKMFARLDDRFGLAYSFCGLGNARRMNDDYKNALIYFKKAETLYKKIGDRVSYAYTLWSVGTTYKMIGKMNNALGSVKESAELFRQTKDPRGKIYCLLGIGEVDYLSGKRSKAKKSYLIAIRHAESYGFGVEKKYAGRLLEAFQRGEEMPFNLP